MSYTVGFLLMTLAVVILGWFWGAIISLALWLLLGLAGQHALTFATYGDYFQVWWFLCALGSFPGVMRRAEME